MKPWMILTTLLSTLLAGASCRTVHTTRPEGFAHCINESQHELYIRWGTEDETTGLLTGSFMNAKGEVFAFTNPRDSVMDTVYAGYLANDHFCQRAAAVQEAFLRTQAMNVRGTKARFVEYVNKPRNVFLRVVWNPDLQTFQSRYFRSEFDSLEKAMHALTK